jgi:aminobenzoyl-glutamate utilization protein B
MPAIVVAALAAKEVMQKNDIKGRLMLWPGVAEELLATKAYFVRDGVFNGVDATIFTHVSSEFSTSWGPAGNTGVVSVEYAFRGRSAHAAGAPWAGRSALDAVELMDIAWNMRREHLPLTHRSHYIISNGGGQPNVVPDQAAVWYYFREQDFAGVRSLYDIGNTIAAAAAMATETTVTRQVLGYAAPNFGNKPLAEAAYENIKAVGMPQWSADDQAFAKSVQEANKLRIAPLASEVAPITTPDSPPTASRGTSDDIGDVMWTVPTITIRYPSNVPNTIAHNVTAAIAMATPIAHKGAVAAGKATAMTILDLVTTPQLIADAKDYFNNVQLKDTKYDPVLRPQDKPGIHLNKDLMERMRPQMSKYYYDPKKYRSYLEQLGIRYPK